MACVLVKKLLGYEICIMEREGTLYYNDNIVLIRKKGFTEIYNLDLMKHETGDVIRQKTTKESVYGYIEDHKQPLLS